jgi:predicted Zn-ribbon and HTH transcriptional regulator
MATKAISKRTAVKKSGKKAAKKASKPTKSAQLTRTIKECTKANRKHIEARKTQIEEAARQVEQSKCVAQRCPKCGFPFASTDSECPNCGPEERAAKNVLNEATTGRQKASKPVDVSVYAVYRDINGVAYLRVGFGPKGSQQFIVNKGFQVEQITMDAVTAQGLDLQPVAGASVLEAARKLLRPLNDNVTISVRAKSTLEEICDNKEIAMKATESKPAKFAAVTAPAVKKGSKAVAAKPAAKTASKKSQSEDTEKAPRLSLVTLKRMPKEGKEEDKLPKQAATILEVLHAKGGKMTTDKLFNALEGKIETAQPIARIYAFYRKRLIDGGFIVVSAA